MLGPPLNAWHVIANDGDAPLRIVGFTNAPPVLDLYRDAAFVFGTDHVFDRGFAGDPGYFEAGPVRRAGERWPVGDSIDPFVTNFVEDVRALTPVMHAWQDKNADFATFAMASAALSPHVSAWAPASYQRAHRHSGGAMVLLLEGSGSFMMWPREAGRQPWEDGRSDAVVRGELRPGGLYSPPTDWFHMHFNESPEPALYLAVTPQGRADRLHYVPDPFHDPLIELYAQRAEPESRFIRVEDEDPEIRQIFDAAVRAHRSDDRPTP
jgi:hypothetical protein